MARKTNGNSPTTRSNKKTAASVPPVPMQVAEVVNEVPRNTKAANVVPGNLSADAPVNLEEAIRRRAYELYLQRRATAGGESGNENQDWLLAEREIRSRLGNQERHSA